MGSSEPVATANTGPPMPTTTVAAVEHIVADNECMDAALMACRPDTDFAEKGIRYWNPKRAQDATLPPSLSVARRREDDHGTPIGLSTELYVLGRGRAPAAQHPRHPTDTHTHTSSGGLAP